MADTILVTGATGTVGSEVIRQLRDRGIPVRAGVHTSEKAGIFSEQGIDVVHIDYEKADTFDTAVAGVDKLFFVGFAGPQFAGVSRQLARTAKQAGVTHFVKLSAYGAGFSPEFYIANAHRESEVAIEAEGIAYTHLRPNVFMQNLINYHGWSIRQEGKFYLAQGNGKVSFIDVRDVGTAAVTVLTQPGHEGKAYTLTGLEALTYHQAAVILSEAVGKPITYVPLSEAEARQRIQAMGQPDFLIDIGVNMDTFGRADGFARITQEFEELAHQEPITFKQFARDYTDAFA